MTRKGVAHSAPVAGGPDQYLECAVSDLHVHPANPRGDVGDIEELAESMDGIGLAQAPLVTPRAEGGWWVVAGSRRVAAARSKGITGLGCVVRHGLTDERVLTIALVENGHRQSLSALEEARALQRLLDGGLTQREVARRIGYSQTWVSNRLTLLRLPSDVQVDVDSGRITTDAAVEAQRVKRAPKAAEAVISGRVDLEEVIAGDGAASSQVEGRSEVRPPAAPRRLMTRADKAESPDPTMRYSDPEDVTVDDQEASLTVQWIEDRIEVDAYGSWTADRWDEVADFCRAEARKHRVTDDEPFQAGPADYELDDHPTPLPSNRPGVCLTAAPGSTSEIPSLPQSEAARSETDAAVSGFMGGDLIDAMSAIPDDMVFRPKPGNPPAQHIQLVSRFLFARPNEPCSVAKILWSSAEIKAAGLTDDEVVAAATWVARAMHGVAHYGGSKRVFVFEKAVAAAVGS